MTQNEYREIVYKCRNILDIASAEMVIRESKNLTTEYVNELMSILTSMRDKLNYTERSEKQ